MAIMYRLFCCLEYQAPLGMENFKITPAQLSASSQYFDHAPNYGRLHLTHHSGSWAAGVNDTNQWIQIDFQIETTATYVATQGRYYNAI